MFKECNYIIKLSRIDDGTSTIPTWQINAVTSNDQMIVINASSESMALHSLGSLIVKLKSGEIELESIINPPNNTTIM